MILQKFKEYFLGHKNKTSVAIEAKELLNNEAFIIAKEALQNDLLEQWGATAPLDVSKRESLYMQYKAVDDVCFEFVFVHMTAHKTVFDRKTATSKECYIHVYVVQKYLRQTTASR